MDSKIYPTSKLLLSTLFLIVSLIYTANILPFVKNRATEHLLNFSLIAVTVLFILRFFLAFYKAEITFNNNVVEGIKILSDVSKKLSREKSTLSQAQIENRSIFAKIFGYWSVGEISVWAMILGGKQTDEILSRLHIQSRETIFNKIRYALLFLLVFKELKVFL